MPEQAILNALRLTEMERDAARTEVARLQREVEEHKRERERYHLKACDIADQRDSRHGPEVVARVAYILRQMDCDYGREECNVPDERGRTIKPPCPRCAALALLGGGK